jgi:hypothetical protein
MQVIVRMKKENGHTAYAAHTEYTAERVAHIAFNLINWRKEFTGKSQSQIG